MRLTTLIPLSIAVWSVYAQGALLNASRKSCLKPAKRREWRKLDPTEREAFVSAVKCLGQIPHNSKLSPTGDTPNLPPVNTSSSYYDDFVYAHMDSNVKDHFTAIFLPWHRWYLHTFLEALQDKCHYEGVLPYWNWSLDVHNITASPVFNSNSKYGLGTLGSSSSNDYAVTDGAFGSTVRAYPSPHIVARKFNLYPFSSQVFPFEFTQPDLPATDALTPQVIAEIVNGSKGNYTDFAYKLDGLRAQGPHNAAHLMMGGDLSSPLVSPNDILFWLHHANLDRIWDKWQNRCNANKNAFGGGLTQDLSNYDVYPVGAPPAANKDTALPTVGLTDPVKVSDVMDIGGNYLCYKYVDY